METRQTTWDDEIQEADYSVGKITTVSWPSLLLFSSRNLLRISLFLFQRNRDKYSSFEQFNLIHDELSDSSVYVTSAKFLSNQGITNPYRFSFDSLI